MHFHPKESGRPVQRILNRSSSIFYKSLSSIVLSKHRRRMHRLAVSAVVAFAFITVAASQLPCNSQLRLSPSFSHLFTHCECSFSEWTDWTVIRTQPVPSSQCPSEKALTEERRQRVVSGSNCDEKREERVVCKRNIICMVMICMHIVSSHNNK